MESSVGGAAKGGMNSMSQNGGELVKAGGALGGKRVDGIIKERKKAGNAIQNANAGKSSEGNTP